ncbi:transactivating tegument protein VP16 [Gallid alphaherpesvirus 1]|nr:transactivating tegument protein VP16 [Gallid alphaherpesvirus 1]
MEEESSTGAFALYEVEDFIDEVESGAGGRCSDFEDDATDLIELEDLYFDWLRNPGPPALVNAPKYVRPSKCSASFLAKNALTELQFADWDKIQHVLKTINIDIFSCVPVGENGLCNMDWFSLDTEKIWTLMDSGTPDVSPNLLITPGPPPECIKTPEEAPAYFEAISNYFESVLAVREAEYAKLLAEYAKSLAKYIRHKSQKVGRGLRALELDTEEAKKRFTVLMKSEYYKGIEKLLIIFLVHLVLNACRDVARIIWVQQRDSSSVLQKVTYRWESQQLHCIFQPLLVSPGPVFLDNDPLPLQTLQHVNYVRYLLGVPALRFSMIEESPSAQYIPYDKTAPSAYDVLATIARTCLTSSGCSRAYHDHTYARDNEKPNYSSSRIVLLADSALDTPMP